MGGVPYNNQPVFSSLSDHMGARTTMHSSRNVSVMLGKLATKNFDAAFWSLPGPAKHRQNASHARTGLRVMAPSGFGYCPLLCVPLSFRGDSGLSYWAFLVAYVAPNGIVRQFSKRNVARDDLQGTLRR